MEKRTAAYDDMARALATRDVDDEIGPADHEIHGVIYRNTADVTLTPRSYLVDEQRFTDENGAPLSDPPPTVVQLRLQRGGA